MSTSDKISTFFGHTINVGHLAISFVGFITIAGGCALRYESRITAMETKFESAVMYGKMRNDGQDTLINNSQQTVTGVQIAVAGMGAKLDGISAQVAALTRIVEMQSAAREAAASARR